VNLERDRVAGALPGYEIGEELGRGAWGIVLRGEHRRLRRPVAIKQLPRAFAADPAVQRRFATEARLLAGLDHPHIVRVYDYVEQEGLCLLVMELLPGGTVWDRLTAGEVSGEAACGIVLATCSALDYAHSRSVLHRDIKPENLLFGAAGHLKVSDFGIAKVLGGSETLTTSSGLMLGTPAYVAPEQVLGREPSPATDVYAVGMLLYELLARRLPFAEDGGLVSLLYRHVHEQPRHLLELAPDVPSAIAGVTMRTLATEPGDRHASAEDLGAELAEAAAAAWGPGWLRRSGLTVMASGRIAACLSASEAGAREGEAEPGERGVDRPGGRAPRTLIEEGARRRPSRPGPDPPHPGRRGTSLTGTEPAPDDVVPLRRALAASGLGPAGGRRRRRSAWRVPATLAVAVLAVCGLVALVAVLHPLFGPTPRHASRSPSPAAPVVRGTLVFSDDFSNPGSGWAPDSGQAGTGSATFGPDGYHVVALQPQNVLNTFSVASPYGARLGSMSVAADGTLLSGTRADGWGVRCDQGGRTGLRYTFEIHGDGSWVIFKIDDKGPAALAHGQSRAIRAGEAVNSVRGDCTELPAGATRLVMSVNDTEVGRAVDAHPGAPMGWHGALVLYRDRSSPAAEVRFSGFQTFDTGSSSG
jgi:hypothetical protein